MWIVRLALARPYTFVVLALAIVLISPLVILRTPTDVLPEIRIPVISVVWNYGGLSPQEMEHRITANYERFLTTTVNNIQHIESQAMQGMGLVKIFFQPDADIPIALSQVTAISQTVLRQLPPGAQPPLIIIYSAATVPVLQMGLSSKTLPEQDLNDLGANMIRTRLATVRGAAVPAPYGGRQHVISVDIDVDALHARGLAPTDIINGINAQNLVLPTGTAKLGPLEYAVNTNASPDSLADLADIPLATINNSIVRLRDVAQVHDGYLPQTNVVRKDGQRGALLSVLKNGTSSTLDVVAGARAAIPPVMSFPAGDIDVTPLFDQSVFVRAAVQSVIREGVIAACLTAALILLFLGSWRSTLVIAISIPLSVLTSICLLSAIGETINLMTLGGLALAVGILVDDATVAIENVERHLAIGEGLNDAILKGSGEIALPAFVSTLCICIVLAPMFLLTGVARYLFVPLAEAVVFAMLASYALSRTLVPTLAMYLLRGHMRGDNREALGPLATFQRRFESWFETMRTRYRRLLGVCIAHPRTVMSVFVIFCLVSAAFAPLPGTDFFPDVDTGQIRLHLRARTGLRIEETVRLCDQVESYLRQVIPPADLGTVLDNIGLPYTGINLSYNNSGSIGTSDAEILVALKPGRRGSTAHYIRELRASLPGKFPGTNFSFQPASIVNQILNFGLPAPIDVQLVGPDRDANYWVAQRMAVRLRGVPGAADVHVQQALDLPSLRIDIDRNRAESMGLAARDVAQSILIGLGSSGQVSPAFWVNPKTGLVYGVVAQWPQYRVESLESVRALPIVSPQSPVPEVLGNLATIHAGVQPAIASRYDVQPVIDIYASTQDRDLGSVASGVRSVMNAFRGELPKGTTLELRGQVSAMTSSFGGLALGLVSAIALVYLLLVVNFQSWLDPLIIITALPGALAGILWMLLLTGTTLNVPSLTGAIMCMGVATANGVLVIAFARAELNGGATAADAALAAGYTRIRPVIITALAMIAGMLPLALGLGEGGEQNAPLGRAVIGGLALATVATLLVVPTVFAMAHSRAQPRGSSQPEPAAQ